MVNKNLIQEVSRLRAESSLQITMSPPPKQTNPSIQLCFLNARSLHRHMNDVQCDLYYISSDVCMFVETGFCQSDMDDMYAIDGFTLFRNDGQSQGANRPYGGTAIYSRLEFLLHFPCQHNRNGIEITVARLSVLPNVNIIVVYRSQRIPVQQLRLVPGT